MGKSKTKKYRPKFPNPTGIPSSKDLEMEDELFMVETGNIDSLLEKLKSRKAEDRECAGVIIANMASNQEFVGSLMREKILRIIAPLLLDKNLAVRHSIAGCLRNMAVFGDYLLSKAMVEQDIMTSLVMLLGEYKDPWVPVQTTENKIDSKSEIFLEVCNLLWILCENCETAVSIFNEAKLVQILLPCLNVEVYGLQIPIAVAQCIHTVGENNSELKEILKQCVVEEQLKSLMTSPSTDADHLLLKTLAAGIKLNLFSGKLKDCMSDVTTPIVEVVFSTLKEPISQRLDTFKNKLVMFQAQKSKGHHENLEEELSVVNKTGDDLSHLLSAKQIAVEIIGNIFDDEEDDDDWEDISSSDSSEIVIQEADMEVDETDVCPNEIELGISFDLYKTIIDGNVFQQVTDQMVKLSAETVNILEHDSKGKDCLKRMEILRSTALLCLNNIIQKGDVDDLGGPTKLVEVWLNLANSLFKETDLQNTDQVEAITRLMSAVVRKIAQAKCISPFNHMTETDLELLINICHQSQDNRTKAHVIQIIGTIGCILGNLESPNSANLIKLIGSVLLDICSKTSNDMWVIAEALDVIFDVFAEDDVDSIAVEINLVERLQLILPVLKTRIKQQKKNFGDHLPVIITARDNLLRFIKYKNTLHGK